MHPSKNGIAKYDSPGRSPHKVVAGELSLGSSTTGTISVPEGYLVEMAYFHTTEDPDYEIWLGDDTTGDGFILWEKDFMVYMLVNNSSDVTVKNNDAGATRTINYLLSLVKIGG